MKVTFWGTRGSICKPGPTTLRYGGNTSCVEVRSSAGTLVVIDCGTGAHGLGQYLAEVAGGAPIDGHLLIGHTHWDHIQGLPFFGPLFQPGNTWHIYGPRGVSTSIRETLAGQMQYAYFPVTTDQMGADVHYHDLVEGRFEIDDITVTTQYLNHPALGLGFRLEADGVSVVYSSDHEPHHYELAAGGDLAASAPDAHHAAFFRNADLLIHDAQYLAAEYAARVGWGHSTVEYVTDAARQAGVRRVALFHHDPGRTDDMIDDIVADARARAVNAGYTGEIFAAAEGAEVVVAPSPAARAVDAAVERVSIASALVKPAIEHIGRSIVLSVTTAAIAATIREAAASEGLEVYEAADAQAAATLAGDGEHALILVENEPEGAAVEFAGSVLRLAHTGPPGLDVIGIGVSRSPSTLPGVAFTDWLVWPSSPGYVRTKLRSWLLRRACQWQNAPLPEDEPERLRSLRGLGVLDSAPEPRFDRLTQLASESLDMPIALVSLVDADRQWFKSKVGIDAPETPRDMSICAHAILEDGVMQVPDALTDERFADNPLVLGDPHLRFYAGAPLTLSDGTRAGTLCVIDYRPRLLSDDQLAELRRLADLVTHELEAR